MNHRNFIINNHQFPIYYQSYAIEINVNCVEIIIIMIIGNFIVINEKKSKELLETLQELSQHISVSGNSQPLGGIR